MAVMFIFIIHKYHPNIMNNSFKLERNLCCFEVSYSLDPRVSVAVFVDVNTRLYFFTHPLFSFTPFTTKSYSTSLTNISSVKVASSFLINKIVTKECTASKTFVIVCLLNPCP